MRWPPALTLSNSKSADQTLFLITIMKKILFSSVVITATALLAGCGGGGTSLSADGSSSSGLFQNNISIDTKQVRAGGSATIAAHVIMRGTTPTSMQWFATPLGATGLTDPQPLFGDLNCTSASYVPPVSSGMSGEGLCRTVLTFPPTAKSGTYRITNTAKAGADSVSGSVDVTVTALPESGFRVLESSTPLTGYVNKPLTLTAPFTVNSGISATNVTYQWTAAPENPALMAIAGAKNSTATAVPTVAGQYRFIATVKARINGFEQISDGEVVAIVNPPNFVDVLDAGLPQFVRPGDLVTLNGNILNRDNTLVYVTSWKQLDGVDGGPARVDLANENSNTSSFVVPTGASTLGTYRFEYKVIKRQPDGTDAISTARTSVIVQAAPVSVFNISAGAAQTGTVGTPVTLTSTVGSQGTSTGVTYSYQWTQTAGTTVTLANANTATASFIPSAAGSYTFRVSVTATSSAGSSTVSADTVVSVTSTTTAPGSGTFAMSASAGAAQSVATNAVVTLAGSQTTQGSSTGVTYAYAWTQTSGAAVTLSNANTPSASFVGTAPGAYGFRLTVTATLADASTRTATSDTQVLVGSSSANTFSVSAGDAQTVAINTAAVMTGSIATQGSLAGTSFSYAWTQDGATPAAVTVSNANALIASFVPTTAGTYTFVLTVTANNGGVTTVRTATTQVLVTP